jgi:fructose-1,6-bisphosphatase/inositol monophosphatase family enzyme
MQGNGVAHRGGLQYAYAHSMPKLEIPPVIPDAILQSEYGEDAVFAVGLADRLGSLMCANLTVGRASRRKPDGTVLTDDDVANNTTAIEAVQSRYPRDSLLGEERSAMVHGSSRVWVLDPIDGTRSYKWGVPVSTVLLGLMVDYEPKLTVCLNPYVSQWFMAAAGKGAYLNGQPCTVSTRDELAKSVVGTSGPSNGKLLDATGARYDLARQGVRVQTIGSTGYESALVGAGQFDGQAFGGPTRHDMVFGGLFIPEARGKVTDLDGAPLDYSRPLARGAVSSNGAVHDKLLAAIQPHVTAIA